MGRVNFLKTFFALIASITLIPFSTAYADSGLYDVLDYDVDYDIENGQLLAIDLDSDFATLAVEIVSFEDGFIEMTIPRGLIDSKYTETEDDIFFVFIDGIESDYLEVGSSEFDRTLLIPFFIADEQIEIFGTDVLSSAPIVEPPEVSEEEPMEDEKEMVEETGMVDEEPIEDEKRGGGCLIATATYGSELAPQVQQLRELRDNSLLQTESGSKFMSGFNQFYYSFSPAIADLERQNPLFKEFVKVTITPLLASLSILNYADMDSETEVLGFGISLIVLNLGIYFVAPAIIIWRIFKI